MSSSSSSNAWKAWKTDQVLEWLEGVNPVIKKKYESSWREEGIDGCMLSELVDDEKTLEEDLGVSSRLHRKRILSAIRELIGTTTAEQKTAAPADDDEKKDVGDGDNDDKKKKKKNVKEEKDTTDDDDGSRRRKRIKSSEKETTEEKEEFEETKDAEDTSKKKVTEEEKDDKKKEETEKEEEKGAAATGTKNDDDDDEGIDDETRSKEVEICFSFDTTGSMYACLGQVRRHIGTLVERLLKDVPHTKIALIAHGDYGDEGETYLMKQCNFSCDKDVLVNWVHNVGSTHGYDGDEAYEYVLREARTRLAWSPTCRRRALVMIGDANPHTHTNNKYDIDWREQCRELAKMNVRIHAVHALGYEFSRNFYQEMAQITGGLYLELGQFQSIRHLILGVALAENKDKAQLAELENEVRREEGVLTRSMKRVFDRLHGRAPTEGSEVPEGLHAVEEGRFQVMDIGEEKVAIKKFAESNGLIFRAGKGFYQFTKPEHISLQKEVVLQHKKTGDFFSGDKARNMLGITAATSKAKKKLQPKDFDDFHVFVQSTSYNRNLVPNTKFLYEVDRER